LNTTDFLRRIWPSSGLYVIARLTGKGFRHTVCETLEEAAVTVAQFDASGVATYHACAAYREREVATTRPNGEVWHQVRTHANVRALKAFWMDLDVEAGNEKKFATQEDALNALVDFCNVTSLPLPMIVSSGGGIHIYWTLTDEILPETWKQTAQGLKALSTAHKFKADGACTGDLARVLRPAGTWNRKIPATPRAVELVSDSVDLDYGSFGALVTAALKAAGIKPPEAIRGVVGDTEDVNATFAVTKDFPPCSGIKVADRCAQLARMRDTRGNIAEPHWYAGIQLLCHATEGDVLIHQWSNGHAQYSEAETSRKIIQIRSQGLGPTLCNTFADRNPGGCDGCPFAGKISSPAQLGTFVQPAATPVIKTEVAGKVVEVTLPSVPAPFTRGEKGGIYIEEEGITHKIYEYDCFPTELAFDEQLGYETMRLRHWLPMEGWRECVLRSSLLASPKDFETALRDQHIQPLIRNKMAMYHDSYIRRIREDTKMRKLFKAQGWKSDDTEFVLGDKLYRKGEILQAGFSHGAKGFLEHIRPQGSIDQWRDLTCIFDTEGLEAHAFMLLTAFAAPLLKLDARQGFTVSALGDTGAGKSTMGKFLASVYGHPDFTWIKRNDTALARLQRIGAYYSLPVYMDEVTTISPKELRDLVYTVSTGKGRDSMRQDYTLREGAEWATILVTSTNDSLQSKLQLEKANAEAESMRLFEFRFPRVKAFGEVAGIVHSVLAENYGVAGPLYIQHLVDNRDRIKSELGDAMAKAEKAFGMDPKERFWSQAVAFTLYAGALARDAGLIDFDANRLRPWLLHETQRMRGTVAETMVGCVAILADYLNEHVGERLVISQLNASMAAVGQRPMRELSSRYEKDAHTLWISRKHIKQYLDSNHFDYTRTRDELVERGILVSADSKKVLGAGTDQTGGQTPCWKLRTNHPEMLGVVN
jgi:hypothetical protein